MAKPYSSIDNPILPNNYTIVEPAPTSVDPLMMNTVWKLYYFRREIGSFQSGLSKDQRNQQVHETILKHRRK